MAGIDFTPADLPLTLVQGQSVTGLQYWPDGNGGYLDPATLWNAVVLAIRQPFAVTAALVLSLANGDFSFGTGTVLVNGVSITVPVMRWNVDDARTALLPAGAYTYLMRFTRISDGENEFRYGGAVTVIGAVMG